MLKRRNRSLVDVMTVERARALADSRLRQSKRGLVSSGFKELSNADEKHRLCSLVIASAQTQRLLAKSCAGGGGDGRLPVATREEFADPSGFARV